ncbi:MAG TPA: hypothetical protein VHX64_05770, partial [Caulobacteraceae bacterium]|nr:hypothetical protein [Caulobacteraceae bacterium]
GLLGAITLLTAAPMGAQAASSNAQALAQSRGVQLIDARWHHHRHWWRRDYCGYYGCGYYYRHRHWRRHWR